MTNVFATASLWITISLVVIDFSRATSSPSPSEIVLRRSKREDPGFPFYFRNYPFVRSVSYLSQCIVPGRAFILFGYNPGCSRCSRAIPQFGAAAQMLAAKGITSGALSIYYSRYEYFKMIAGMGYVYYPVIVLFNRRGQMIHYNGRDASYATMWDFYHFAMTNE